MIRLVVCDVDGTLVKDGGSASALNPEYYEVVRKLSEKGIQVVICSGRQKASIEKLFEPVKARSAKLYTHLHRLILGNTGITFKHI